MDDDFTLGTLEDDPATKPCPRCESPQKFPKRFRDTGITGVKKAYVSCTVCPYTEVIGYTTRAIEEARSDLARALRLAQEEIDRHGYPSDLTLKRIQRLRKSGQIFRARMMEKVRNADSSST
jgi:hypothetical protein